MTTSESERFDDLWAKNAGSVYAYAVRRVGRDQADEVVADVFAVVWRRIDQVPDRALPWLYGVGRNVIRQHHRSEFRRARLQDVLEQQPTTDISSHGEVVLAALSSLDGSDQEILRLIAWEGLVPKEAAEVLGISGAAFRTRLTRARRRFRAVLEKQKVVEYEV